MTNRLEITNESGEKLVCIEVRPESDEVKKLPAVILCHGFAYFKEEDGIFTETAKRLASHGFAVYYFDFSGCGESEGDYSKTTLSKLVADLKSVYDKVTSLEYIDSNDISLMSHSFGSNVIIAAQIPHIRRIVLSGAFSNPHHVLSNLFPNFNELGVSSREGSKGSVTTIEPQFWKDLKKYDIAELINNFDCPILFIHGGQDYIVPIENMYPLLEAAKNPDGPIILDKSNHDLQPQREQAFKAIENFFTN